MSKNTIESNSLKTNKFSQYQLFVIILLATLQFTVVLDFAIISPLGDVLMKGLEIDTTQFGFLVSSYAFGAGIAGIFAAVFADKFDRKYFLLFFYLGFLIGTFFCGLANSYTTLLIARSATGLFGGVISSISLAIASDLFALNQRGRVMGYIQMAFSASQVLGLPMGLYIANQWGWNSTFFTIVAMGIPVCILVIFKLRPIKDHQKLQSEEQIFKRFLRILSTKEYALGYLFVMLTALGGAMIMPFSATFLINNIKITQAELPIIFVFTGLSTAIIMPLVGRISDRVDKSKVYLIGSVIAIIMTVIYVNLTPIPIWAVILINIVLFVGISSRMIPANALNTAIPDLGDRGAYMSLCSSLQQMSNGVGALIAGLIVVQHSSDHELEHFDTLGYVLIFFIVMCMLLIKKINRQVNAKIQEGQ